MYQCFDPSTYNNKKAQESAVLMIAHFCLENGLDAPYVHAEPTKKVVARRDADGNPTLLNDGYCTGHGIHFGLGVTPAKNPGHSWSFPGYKIDMTAIGIAAHELGHWFHIKRGRGVLAEFAQRCGELPGKRITNYEPNVMESFSESTRLYVLNPDLLKEAVPARFAALQAVGMKTIYSATWRQVLEHAGDKRIAATEKWIAT